MSYFPKGVVYILVPELSVTNEMLNNMKRDFHVNSSTIRKSNELLASDRDWVFKVKEPISAVFNGYTWYNWDDIQTELQNSRWS